MPVIKNEDGTVNCIPPWDLKELLEIAEIDFQWFDRKTIMVSTRPRGGETEE